jgi:hypothetical protein
VTLTLTVNPNVTGAETKTICSNQLPFAWNGQSYNAAGTYSVTLQSAAGCDSVVTLTLTVRRRQDRHRRSDAGRCEWCCCCE